MQSKNEILSCNTLGFFASGDKSLIDKNYKWIYTYDYAPDSVWEPWRKSDEEPEWIQEEAKAVVVRAFEDELYEKIRRENTMCEALRELMKDEIDREVEKAVGEAVEKTERDTRIKTRYEDGMSLDEIASRSNVSIEIVNQVLKEKGMIE
jgi:Mor family transcriptional regulator